MIDPVYNVDAYPKWVTETVLIVPPDPQWAEKAAREIRELNNLLAGIRAVNFEHIGSTSVPGLPAKPIIDILAEIPDFDDITMEAIAQKLSPHGWHFTPPELDTRPYRRFFIKVENDARAAHLQFLLPGSPQRTDQLRFRNRLKASAQLRADYATLKQELAEQHTKDREAYTHAKTSFVKNTLSAPVRIVFATNNENKVKEIRTAVGENLQIVSLREAGIDIDIPEPWDTLEANATEKSSTIYRLTGGNCFSEDSGLEVTALNGEPGVHSARYAGDDRSPDANIRKLLNKLASNPNRGACFRTVISLIWEGKEHLFEGVCEGHILQQPIGETGFGYDPIFVPKGDTRSFAQMSPEEKNHYSHRRKAADQLVAFLRKASQTE
jgi:XTP/dITP diphosphohydrolase